jgi:hypothetical protein
MKDKIKQVVQQHVQAFFQEEQGNRITSNNIEGFAGKLFRAIDQIPERKDEDKSE